MYYNISKYSMIIRWVLAECVSKYFSTFSVILVVWTRRYYTQFRRYIVVTAVIFHGNCYSQLQKGGGLGVGVDT